MEGSITPRSAERGATAAATGAPGRRGVSTIGRSRATSASASASVTSARARAASRSGTIRAKGLSSRCLRARSRATASSSSARQARWNPPSPLTATIAPSRRAATAPASGSPARGRPAESVSASRGPQSGQALGCAWKRRSAGSSYSARQAGHMTKPAIVVSGRSYGTPRTIVKRGPQFVQLTNG